MYRYLLLLALAFVSFRWYQTSQTVLACRQDLQAMHRLLAFCNPVVQQYNYGLFQYEMTALTAYRTDINERMARQFLHIDSLGQVYDKNCDQADTSALPTIARAYADSMRIYTDGDSLTATLLQKVLKGRTFQSQYPDTLLRQQAKLQLALLQSLGLNYLAGRMAICGDFRFDGNDLVLVPHQMEAKVGRPFEAQLFLVNRPLNNFRVETTINGQNCRLIEGRGEFKTMFQRPGQHQLHLKTQTFNVFTGEVQTSVRTVDVLVTT